jgi:hypothetical protein
MLRTLALVGFCSAGLVLAGCRGDDDTQTPVDLSRAIVGDGGDNTPSDLSMTIPHMTTNPHDIDTGVVPKGTLVSLPGLVILTPADSFASSKGAKCTYQVLAQDPTCTTPPCGLYVNIITAFTPRTPGDTTHCPYADTAGSSFFAGAKVGDNIDITGTSDAFTTTGGPTEHSVVTDSIVKSANTAKVTAVAVTIAASNDTQFVYCPKDVCAANSGAGWSQYEGTYVKLTPASGPFTIASNPQITGTQIPYYFMATPGNVSFSASNAFIYDSNDGGVTVTNGKTFTSIAGAVDLFNTTIDPVFSDDFTP